MTVALRERLCGATLGERASNRVSASAVGRRGRFPEGRVLPIPETTPLREMTERGREADPKAGVGEQVPGQRTATAIRGRLRRQGTASGSATGAASMFGLLCHSTTTKTALSLSSY